MGFFIFLFYYGVNDFLEKIIMFITAAVYKPATIMVDGKSKRWGFVLKYNLNQFLSQNI
jgi:hypothetical protein